MSVFVDIYVINSFTCFLIFMLRNLLFDSCLIASCFYLNAFPINFILMADSLDMRSSLTKSLFFYLNPSIMYSISPGVWVIMNDFLVLTILLLGKCSF